MAGLRAAAFALAVILLGPLFGGRSLAMTIDGGCVSPAVFGAETGLAREALELRRGGFVLRGVVERPEGRAVTGVVVFLHGFTGTRDELRIAGGQGLFEYAARELARAGLVSVRFDFIGSGDSDGSWADTTLEGQAEDTRAVLEALRGRDEYRGTPIHLLGFSQGGLVALDALAGGARAESAVLWNPVLDPRGTYARIFGEQGLERAIASPAGQLVSGTRLRQGFFAGIDAADPVASGSGYPGPLLVVVGRRDSVAVGGPERAAELTRARRGLTRVLEVDADHALGTGQSTETIDRVLACSAAAMLSPFAGPGGAVLQ